MARATFQVFGQLGKAGRAIPGKVIIDRTSGLFSVRPHRSKRVFTVGLNEIAQIAVERVIKMELREAAKDKKAAAKQAGRRRRIKPEVV